MKKFLSLSLFNLCLLGIFNVSARDVKIIIASENSHKVNAVKKVFKEKFSNESVKFVSIKSDSGIPEQPISKEVALKGARNRINNLHDDIVNSADCIISIENYIEQSPFTKSWCDVGLVLIQDSSGSAMQEIISFTQPIFIPEQFVNLAKVLSFGNGVTNEGYSVTVGEAIQKTFIDRSIDPSNWHSEPEFGGVSRQQLIQDAVFKAIKSQDIHYLKNQITFYPDFPKPGIIFADFLPILNDSYTFKVCIDLLAEHCKEKNIDVVVGLESRGFILGAALAYELGVGFVPVRKPGKLPGPIHSISYEKEYGSDSLSIAQNVFKNNERVLIVDDLIATGGTARASIKLVRLAGGIPVEFVSLLQIKELAEYTKLGIPSFNLID